MFTSSTELNHDNYAVECCTKLGDVGQQREVREGGAKSSSKEGGGGGGGGGKDGDGSNGATTAAALLWLRW